VFRLVQTHLACFDDDAPVDLDALDSEERGLHRKTHQTIKRVTDSIETNFHFNTAISAVMELVNQISAATGEGQNCSSAVLRESLETVLLLLFPMVPHFCEELWQNTGHQESMDSASWPRFDPDAAREDELTIVVQVNGKVRTRLQVAPDISDDQLKEMALADERVVRFMDGRTAKKIIVVQRKLVNIVV
jgi:leucyl-tRNA synthetase